MKFTLTDDPVFLWQKMSLSVNLNFGLFLLNDNFSKTKNKIYHSKHIKGLKLQSIQLLEATVSSTLIQIKVIIETFKQGSVTDLECIIFSLQIQAPPFSFSGLIISLSIRRVPSLCDVATILLIATPRLIKNLGQMCLFCD